jgi:DNA-binding transcriptional ArsR family regulator
MFKALSVETRVKIIEILKNRGPMGAKKIAQIIGITPAAISQHLRMLKHVGLVRSQRNGYWIPYKIDERAMEDCRSRMNQVCSFGHGPSHMLIMRRHGLRSAESLERYKKQLEQELEKVNHRLEELEAKKKT